MVRVSKDDILPLGAFLLWLVALVGFWGLAFWPLSLSAPQWLQAARIACFGATASGLPDTGGWILLTLAPLSMLVVLLLTWGAELKRCFDTLRSTYVGKLLILCILGALLFKGHWVGQKIRVANAVINQEFSSQINEPFPESYPLRMVAVEDFELIDHTGEQIRLSSATADGGVVVLSFAFANCKTICPMIVSQTLEAHRKFDGLPIRSMIVTLDPWRDTPSSLKNWSLRTELPPGTHLLSGQVSQVLRVLDIFEVPYRRNETTGDIDHPPLTHIIVGGPKIAFSLGNVPSEWITSSAIRALKLPMGE